MSALPTGVMVSTCIDVAERPGVRVGLAAHNPGGSVIMAWLLMSPREARELARQLFDHADRIDDAARNQPDLPWRPQIVGGS